MKKTVLLPLDGSEISLNALLPAKSIAVLLNMDVRILYVSDETLSQSELIQKVKVDMDGLPGCIITHEKGNPAEIILKEAESAGYVVISSHGQGYDPEKISGSVATRVIENTATPVLLIRPNVKITREDSLWEPKHVLIPLDGSPCSCAALEPTMQLIARTKSELDLLHISVVKGGKPAESGIFTVPYYEDYPHHEWHSWAKEFIRRFAPALHNGVNVELFVSTGDPGEEIVNFAKSHDNDLIAVAWHGHLAPPHAIVLRKIMYEAPCPVLLTKVVDKQKSW